jgi:hypothetical protein
MTIRQSNGPIDYLSAHRDDPILIHISQEYATHEIVFRQCNLFHTLAFSERGYNLNDSYLGDGDNGLTRGEGFLYPFTASLVDVVLNETAAIEEIDGRWQCVTSDLG